MRCSRTRAEDSAWVREHEWRAKRALEQVNEILATTDDNISKCSAIRFLMSEWEWHRNC